MKLELLKSLAATHQRPMIAPKAEVKASTPAERQQIAQLARKVIAEHRDVLTALKDR